MTSKLSKIIISILGIAFLIFVFIYPDNETKWLLKNGSVAEGEIVESNYAAYNLIYYVNGFKHNLRIKPPLRGLQIGEFYKILYDPNNPDVSTVSLRVPIIKNEEEYTTTKSLSVRKLWGNDLVEFTYLVNNIKYERDQRLASNVKIDENRIYSVKYNKYRPKIAYLVISNTLKY